MKNISVLILVHIKLPVHLDNVLLIKFYLTLLHFYQIENLSKQRQGKLQFNHIIHELTYFLYYLALF